MSPKYSSQRFERIKTITHGAAVAERKRWTATGQPSGDMDVPIFTDPVTGSSVKGGWPEHFEPLGQRIDPMPPLEDPTFPGPNDGFNDARFAEWQCKAAENLGRSFSEMPVHCQRAAAARDVWKRMHVELPKEEGNAAKLTDGPMDYAGPSSLGTQTFATRLMGKALYSTKKDDDEPKADIGEISVEVKAGIDMSEIPGFIDASISSEYNLAFRNAASSGSAPQSQQFPECVQNAIVKYYESVGNSSANRMKRVANVAAGARYSTNGFPLLSPPNLGRVAGKQIRAYTQPNRVHFNHNEYDPTTAYGMALIIHEFTHLMQFAEIKNFSVRYVKEWLRNGNGEKNVYERRGYVNQTNSEKFFTDNPNLLCR